jgi:hypothetical protein
MIGEFVIVRSRDQGVVCGVLRIEAGSVVELEDARQIHSWTDGAHTLFEMSSHGVGKARISEPVARIRIREWCGIIPCTEEAKWNLTQSRWDKRAESSGNSRKAAPKS